MSELFDTVSEFADECRQLRQRIKELEAQLAERDAQAAVSEVSIHNLKVRVTELEASLAERSEWTPVAYPGDEIDQKFVFEKMEEIYSTYKRNGHRDTLAVCRRVQREDAK